MDFLSKHILPHGLVFWDLYDRELRGHSDQRMSENMAIVAAKESGREEMCLIDLDGFGIAIKADETHSIQASILAEAIELADGFSAEDKDILLREIDDLWRRRGGLEERGDF